MKHLIGFLPALGVAAALGVTPVAASAQGEQPGDWQYAEGPETCRAFRDLGDGEDRVRVLLRSFGPGSAVEVTVSGAGLPHEPSAAREVEFGWGSDGFEHNQVGILGTAGGVPSVSLLAAHRPVASFAFFFNERLVVVSPLDPAAETMQLRVIGNAPRAIHVGPLEQPLHHLEECEAGLMERWGWGRDYSQTVATPPEMREPQRWFESAIIYPAVANLKRVSSLLQLRLKVDTEGKVAECVVQSSPGSSQFGEKNCRGMRRIARFDPARDSQGRPVEGYVQMSITFARFD